MCGAVPHRAQIALGGGTRERAVFAAAMSKLAPYASMLTPRRPFHGMPTRVSPICGDGCASRSRGVARGAAGAGGQQSVGGAAAIIRANRDRYGGRVRGHTTADRKTAGVRRCCHTTNRPPRRPSPVDRPPASIYAATCATCHEAGRPLAPRRVNLAHLHRHPASHPRSAPTSRVIWVRPVEV